MASTNKTTNYQLSQFLGSDKPAWLGDYNADMQKIDTGMKANNDLATSADGKANSANTAIGDINSLETTDKTSLVSAVNEVKSDATTAQNTANSAQTTANSADTKVSTLTSKFNLNVVKDNISATTNLGNITANTLKCVTNSDGSVAKIYGHIAVNSSQSASALVVNIGDTGLRPSAPLTITGSMIRFITTGVNPTSGFSFADNNFVINTDGTISVTLSNNAGFYGQDLQFIACLLFIEDFSD